MRRSASIGCVLLLSLCCVAGAATRYTVYVQPGAGTTERDGPVYGAGGAFAEPNNGIGFCGRYGGASMWMVAKFKLSDFLPPGTTAADISQAYLSVPYTDVLWSGDPFTAMDVVLHHFATTNDTTITGADHDAQTPPLTNYGIVIPRHTRSVNRTRRILVNVTAAVKDDLTQGRALSSFRVGADPAGDLSTNDYTYFATADNNDAFFGPLTPFGERNILKLIILNGPGEICDNGQDDDGDGLIDCADTDECDDLFFQQPCHETECSDGLNNDYDGRTDCDDTDCYGRPGCTTETNCRDGADNDGDGLVDCRDPNCFGQAGCTVETACNDNQDNDLDGLIDCADPDDCYGRTGCTVEGVGNNNTCADGRDNDFDCMVDGSDTDCAATGVVVKALAAQDDSCIVSLGSCGASPAWAWSYGQYNGSKWVAIAMITIPAGTQAADVGRARLRIPNTDVLWNAEPASADASVSAMNLVAEHIDAADDTVVTFADATSPSLGRLGVYRAPGPRNQNGARFTELDVTQAVKDDITAGRLTFAFRIEYENPPAVSDVASYYSPSADNTDGYFPASNRGARLLLLLPGTFESSCTDGIDNESDGAIDCADADCYGSPACTTEVCRNGIDDDGDGFTDCNDTDCVAFTCCLPAETGPVLCANGVDDDLDGKVDCLDRGCASQPNCREGGAAPPSADCHDGADNDGDGLVDCADPDCWTYPLCTFYQPFADADHDYDVDMTDFARYQLCYSGTQPVPPGCAYMDRDLNNKIDKADFDAFKLCATGPAVLFNLASPPPGCMP